MIYAEMKGKIPPSEDVLTSNVFGLLKLLNDRTLCLFFNELLGDKINFQVNHFDCTEFCLWKRISGKEPDIYVKLKDGTEFIIEIKYGSSESSENQLGTYLNLIKSENKFLIYLTSDRTEPLDVTKKTDYKNLRIYWNSWYHVNEICKKLSECEKIEYGEKKIFKLLNKYLIFKQFVYFDGWYGWKFNKTMKPILFYSFIHIVDIPIVNHFKFYDREG